MPIILPNGLIADTGVSQESPAHQIMESKAHQRDTFPYITNSQVALNFFYESAWSGAPGSLVNVLYPNWDAFMQIMSSYTDPHSNYVGDLGVVDAYGYEASFPAIDPAIVFDNSAMWSADASGSPYFGTAGSDTGGPVYGYVFNYGTSMTINWNAWFKAGTYGSAGTSLQFSDLFGPTQFMNPDCGGVLTLGDVAISFNRATGFSGTGISGNSSFTGPSPGYSGNSGWNAQFNHTFPTRFQASATFGPMSFWNGGGLANTGGGGLTVGIVTPFP